MSHAVAQGQTDEDRMLDEYKARFTPAADAITQI